MKVEIDKPLDISPDEENKLTMHSLYNIVGVIITILEFFRDILENKQCMEKSISLCNTILYSFGDEGLTLNTLENLEKYKSIIREDVYETLETSPNVLQQKLIQELLENLNDVFDVLDVRTREIMARLNAQDPWVLFSVEDFKKDIRNVLDAIVKNSMGRYGIVYDPQQQGSNNYLVELCVESHDGKTILMPAIVQDCFRDLIANARKYTPPGGQIKASLVDDGSNIVITVSDTGRGIPENEIAKVVEYGVRGSNTLKSETHGGGFGLTKAYYVCKQFKGRMWIDSDLGKGTIVTLCIPHILPANKQFIR
ncbi:MAG: sensor histidine kinase [Planctomycetes bacterium]|nr:sensor histidine kinase [Planctomycetota bacterium]